MDWIGCCHSLCTKVFHCLFSPIPAAMVRCSLSFSFLSYYNSPVFVFKVVSAGWWRWHFVWWVFQEVVLLFVSWLNFLLKIHRYCSLLDVASLRLIFALLRCDGSFWVDYLYPSPNHCLWVLFLLLYTCSYLSYWQVMLRLILALKGSAPNVAGSFTPISVGYIKTLKILLWLLLIMI